MKTFKLIVSLLVMLMIMAGCGGGGRPPQVETFYPDPAVDGNVSSADIQANGIKVIFSEGMSPATINSTSFTIEEWTVGGTAILGTVTYDESVRTATFMPTGALTSAWDYVVTITTTVTDLAGHNMVADYVVTIRIADPVPGPIP